MAEGGPATGRGIGTFGLIEGTADTVEPDRVNMYECWESEDTLAAFRSVGDAPELHVEMRDMAVSKFSVDGRADPFD